MSKRRNRLAPARAEKLIYIYFNRRSLVQAEHRMGPGVTEAKLASWAKLLDARDGFKWPSTADGAHLFAWDDNDDEDDAFDGMFGDQMDEAAEGGEDQEAADQQAEAAAFEPFEPDNFKGEGESFEVLPCPTRVPHDLELGRKVALWFGEGYNAWYMGKIELVNKRRTKQDNVTAEFCDETYGKTWGHWCASMDNYGADHKWVLLKPILIELDDEEEPDTASPAAASGSKS